MINHNSNWLYIPDYPYKVFIMDRSQSGKSNTLWNLIKHQRPDIDKIYLYVSDTFETKHKLFIKGREKLGINKQKLQRHALIFMSN